MAWFPFQAHPPYEYWCELEDWKPNLHRLFDSLAPSTLRNTRTYFCVQTFEDVVLTEEPQEVGRIGCQPPRYDYPNGETITILEARRDRNQCELRIAQPERMFRKHPYAASLIHAGFHFIDPYADSRVALAMFDVTPTAELREAILNHCGQLLAFGKGLPECYGEFWETNNSQSTLRALLLGSDESGWRLIINDSLSWWKVDWHAWQKSDARANLVRDLSEQGAEELRIA